MNNNEELLKKWQLKKIATLAFINDECDDMKPKDRRAFYSMMEAIFGEIVVDLKNLTLAAVSKSVDVERRDAVCDHPENKMKHRSDGTFKCLKCKQVI